MSLIRGALVGFVVGMLGPGPEEGHQDYTANDADDYDDCHGGTAVTAAVTTKQERGGGHASLVVGVLVG